MDDGLIQFLVIAFFVVASISPRSWGRRLRGLRALNLRPWRLFAPAKQDHRWVSHAPSAAKTLQEHLRLRPRD